MQKAISYLHQKTISYLHQSKVYQEGSHQLDTLMTMETKIQGVYIANAELNIIWVMNSDTFIIMP